MKIAVYNKAFNHQILPDIIYFFNQLKKYEVQLSLYETFYHEIKEYISFEKEPFLFKDRDTLRKDEECLISLGGDGTILEAVGLVRKTNIPIIGINLGRLGFLASIQKEEVSQALEALFSRNYTLDTRTLITVDSKTHMFGKENFALNDIAIQKRDDASMMVIHAYLNNEFICTYWANGLIVATPTGSTAYSLSCGGPVIYPATNTLVLTPIAPHNLNVRPLIFPDNYELSLQLEGRSAKYLVSCDSKTEIVDNFAALKITKADFEINLLRLHNESYLKTLRNKLHWGIDARNY